MRRVVLFGTLLLFVVVGLGDAASVVVCQIRKPAASPPTEWQKVKCGQHFFVHLKALLAFPAPLPLRGEPEPSCRSIAIAQSSHSTFEYTYIVKSIPFETT